MLAFLIRREVVYIDSYIFNDAYHLLISEKRKCPAPVHTCRVKQKKLGKQFQRFYVNLCIVTSHRWKIFHGKFGKIYCGPLSSRRR